jgi:hypothetical protein
VTAAQQVPQLLGIGPEKSPTRPLAHRLGPADWIPVWKLFVSTGVAAWLVPSRRAAEEDYSVSRAANDIVSRHSRCTGEHLVEPDFLGISGRHRRLLTPAPAATLKLNILRWLRLLVAASGASTGAAMGAGLEGADLP